MSDFFFFDPVEENDIWIVFKRTAYTTSGSGIRQQVILKRYLSKDRLFPAISEMTEH